MKRKGLSVTIITLNEETEIGACLESVAWADEIVVVDSGSTDRTVKICKEYTDRVIFQPWLGFSGQKNFALSQVTHDWVFSLDADERVTPELREELLSLLEGEPSFNGYSVSRKNFFRGRWIRHCGWYPDYTLRFFNHRKGYFVKRAVHERVELSGPIGYLKYSLEHYTYRSLSDFIQRTDRYSTLAAQEMHEEGRRFQRVDLCLRPLVTFWKMFLFRQGFREGMDGLILSGLYGYYTFLKYAKLWEMECLERGQV